MEKSPSNRSLTSLRDDKTLVNNLPLPEAEVRQDFIDHLWKLLCWPIGEQGNIPVALRDVRIETNIGTAPRLPISAW